MLACTEIVTLVRHIAGEDDDTYKCVTVEGASWFAKTAIVGNGTRLTTGNVLKCRIPDGLLKDEDAPRTGDYLVRGAIASVRKPADLKGYSHFKVEAVGDNRRGGLPHWVVSGA